MTDPTPGRPLVTFVLFAFNQEKYIREAVEGAFSQTYEPLEIILSDDCSSDRTYQIMQEMAAAYAGPHSVKLNRNIINRGFGAHVNAVLGLLRSEWVIVSAGDDISTPERTSLILDKIRSSASLPTLIHSSVIKIAEDGKVLGVESCRFLRELTDLTATIESRAYALGATAAWHRSLYENFGPLPDHLMYEDQIFQVRALLMGGLYYIDRPLVKHRTGGVTSVYREHTLSEKKFGVSNDRWIIAREQQIIDLKRSNANPRALDAAMRQLRLCLFRRSMRDSLSMYTKIRLAGGYAKETRSLKEAAEHLLLSLLPRTTQILFNLSMKMRS